MQENLSRCFSSNNKLNQETFSDGEHFPSDINSFFGSNETFFKISYTLNVAKSRLDGDSDHILAEARSELMKQEYKVESFNTCSCEHQRQTHSQRLELDDAHVGYEESRREQVRPQEEQVMREKALRDTRIRSIHEMEELRRAQELRVDEFSVQKLRESHDTIQQLASQMQELQERVNCMNDSGEFQHIEISKDLRSAIYAELRQKHAT